ncbi:MAG: hypothetical protein JSR85_05620 [Proteobacteria bacterium]|nr:hypothetical protein [Pseudomonadota bacterium]
MALGITDLFSTVSAIALSLFGDVGTVTEKQIVSTEHTDSSTRTEAGSRESAAKHQDKKDLPTLKGSGGGEGSIASPKAKATTSKGIDLPSRGSGSVDETQYKAENQAVQVSSGSSGSQVTPRRSLPQDFVEPSPDEVSSSPRSHVPSPSIQDSRSPSPSNEGVSIRSPQTSGGHAGEGASDASRSSGGGGSGFSSLESLQEENKSLRAQLSDFLSGVPSSDQVKEKDAQQQGINSQSIPSPKSVIDSSASFENMAKEVQPLSSDSKPNPSQGSGIQKANAKKPSTFIATKPGTSKAIVEESPEAPEPTKTSEPPKISKASEAPANIAKNHLPSSPKTQKQPLPAKFIAGKTPASQGTTFAQLQDATISAEVVESARVLGFDLNTPYKDVAEAIRVLAQKVSGKNTAAANELERIFNQLDSGALKIEDQAERIRELYQEGEKLGVHQKLLTEFLRSRYARPQVVPSKEDMDAAQALGFDLNTPYKDVAEAIRVLAQKVSGKNTAAANELERIFNQLDSGALKIEDQAERIRELAQEGEKLGAHQKRVAEFLKKKYAQAPKKKVQTKTAGTGGTSQDLFNQIRGVTVKDQTPAELEEEIRQLEQQMRDFSKQEQLFYAADKPRDAKVAKEQAEAAKKEIIEKKNLLVKLTTKTKSAEDASNGTAKRKPNLAAQEEQTRVVTEYKVSHPDLAPFMELLAPKDQANFLKAKVKILYNENGERPVNLLSKNNKTRELPLDYLLSRLTEEQRATLLKGIESRVDEDPGSESNIRFSALKYFPNFQALEKYDFPVWTEELARLAAPPARKATLQVPALNVDQETEKEPVKAVDIPSASPKGPSTEPVRELEEHKGQDLGKKKVTIGGTLIKGPSSMVLRSRGLTTKTPADETD